MNRAAAAAKNDSARKIPRPVKTRRNSKNMVDKVEGSDYNDGRWLA